MSFTETAIKNAKPRDKAYKLADGGGLYLLVTPIGSRLWRLKYRFDGRETLSSFGPHPVTGIKKARVNRDETKALLIDKPTFTKPREMYST